MADVKYRKGQEQLCQDIFDVCKFASDTGIWQTNPGVVDRLVDFAATIRSQIATGTYKPTNDHLYEILGSLYGRASRDPDHLKAQARTLQLRDVEDALVEAKLIESREEREERLGI